MKSKIDPPHKLPIKWSASPLREGVMVTARLEMPNGDVAVYGLAIADCELELSNYLIVPMAVADMTAMLIEYAENYGL